MIDTTYIVPLTQMPSLSEIKNVKTGDISTVSGIKNTTGSFADTLKQKILDVKNLEQTSLNSAYAVSMGKTDDIEGAMIDATKASVAIETTVQLTTRAVNAYKEIMQMQI